MALLVVGCCSSLTCLVPEDARMATMPVSTVRTRGARVGPASEHEFKDDSVLIRSVTETRRIGPRLARMAVSSVEGPRETPLLRLDTALLGTGAWLTSWLQHGGLAAREEGDFVLAGPAHPGVDRAGLRAQLREMLPSIHSALDRIRRNLRARHTAGHKPAWGALERVVSQDPVAAAPAGDEAIRVDVSQGDLVATHLMYDLAIDGRGLFVLYAEEQGRTFYTRDGRFACREDGVLVSSAVRDAVLMPRITIPRKAVDVSILPNGLVRVRTGESFAFDLGRLELSWFRCPERLEPMGDGRFARTPEAGEEIRGHPGEKQLGRLVQGAVERSNLDLFDGWTRLCRLEDARQLVVAMIAELDGRQVGPGGEAWVEPDESPAGAWRDVRSSTVSITLPEPEYDAIEPTLLRYLRTRGVDFLAGPGVVALKRDGYTARVLVGYLKFLRRRLNVISVNIEGASSPPHQAGAAEPYRRKIVTLNGRGEEEISHDMSPFHLAWINAAGDADGSLERVSADHVDAGPQLVSRPNVDVTFEMDDGDAVLREYRTLREALRAIGSAAVRPLAELLEDPASEMQCDAAWALGEIGLGARVAVPSLVTVLQDGDRELRRAAAGALRRIAPESAVVTDAIVEMWRTALQSETRSERYEAAVALGRLGPRASAAVGALTACVQDPTSGAARALGRIGAAAAPAVGSLIDVLKSREVRTRRLAADAIGRIGRAARSAVPSLVAAMKDEDPEVRWRAAAAIGRIGSEDSGCTEALIALLQDEDTEVRDHVASALGQLETHTAQGSRALRRLCNVQEPQQRVWPLWALAMAGDRTMGPVVALTKMLTGGDLDVRRTVCLALGKLGSRAAPAVGVLTRMARAEDEKLAMAAIEALGAVGPAAASATGVLSIALGSADPFVRRRAAEALGRIGPAAAVALPALEARLSDSSEEVVLAATVALGRMGEPATECTEALTRLRGSKSPRIRSAAIVALSILGEESGSPIMPGSRSDTSLAISSTEPGVP